MTKQTSLADRLFDPPELEGPQSLVPENPFVRVDLRVSTPAPSFSAGSSPFDTSSRLPVPSSFITEATPRPRRPPKLAVHALLVDDTAARAQLVVQELRRTFDVVTFDRVADESAFVEAVTNSRYQVIICDTRTAQLNALTVLGLCERHALDLPVIVLSDAIGEEAAVEAMRAGAHDVLRTENLARLGPTVAREVGEAAARIELRRAEARLREREKALASVLDGVTDAVLLLDQSGCIIACNRASSRLFGYDENEIIGTAVHHLIPGFTPQMEATLETTAVRASGSEFTAQVMVNPDANEECPRWICTVRDVSEERSVKARLQAADRLISVGGLAAGVAHDINNPLSYVLVNLQMVLGTLESFGDRAPSPAEVADMKELVESAIEGTDRVRLIVKDMMTYSRGTSDENAPIDLTQVLNATINVALNEIRHRARLVRDFSPTPPVVGTASRLGQVFLNLLVNAAQAIPEGRAHENEVRVSLRPAQFGWVAIEITDTGTGIPADNLKQIFEPFYTTKGPSLGTGLGLSISQSIIKAMNGRIEVESEVGRGTCFRILLPTSDARPTRPPSDSPTVPPKRKLKVLVIDDEPAVGSSLRLAVRDMCDVVPAGSTREALQHIERGTLFDVILCDVMMPELTGIDFYEMLGQAAPSLRQRVIFMTGGAFTERAQEFLNSLDQKWLEKPIDLTVLRAAIAERASLPLVLQAVSS